MILCVSGYKFDVISTDTLHRHTRTHTRKSEVWYFRVDSAPLSPYCQTTAKQVMGSLVTMATNYLTN